MTTPFTPPDLPRNPQQTGSPGLNPQFMPLLDLLADLLAHDLRKHSKTLNEYPGDEGSEGNAPASVQAGSSLQTETPRKTGPFPSFPAESHPDFHKIPNHHPHADKPVRAKEKKS
jgi:hypothetical protein